MVKGRPVIQKIPENIQNIYCLVELAYRIQYEF